MVHCAYPLNALSVLGYRSGNSMKSFDVVNVLSQRNVCREVPVEEEETCSFQWSIVIFLDGQADVLLISPAASLG